MYPTRPRCSPPKTNGRSSERSIVLHVRFSNERDTIPLILLNEKKNMITKTQHNSVKVKNILSHYINTQSFLNVSERVELEFKLNMKDKNIYYLLLVLYYLL